NGKRASHHRRSVTRAQGRQVVPRSRSRLAFAGRPRWIVQRLELRDQRRHFLTQLYLSEEDAHRAVPVHKEVGTLSASPAEAVVLGSLGLYGHSKAPPGAVPEPREEAVRGLARCRHLVAGHLL